MLGSKRSFGTKHFGLAAAALAGLALLPDLSHAGPLTELALHGSNLRLHRPMDLCVGGARSASCRSTIETALRAATTTTGTRLYDTLASSNQSRQTLSAASAGEERELAGHSLALKFNDDPEWKRRAKVMARDGLPFMRLPESGNRELLVGITPHGMFGFSLKDKTSD
jgi:hypothetical protein